jgi:hypothetical protein
VVAVEVVGGEGPGEVPMQAQGAFDLVEGTGVGRMTGRGDCGGGDSAGGVWSNESRAAHLVRGPVSIDG